MSSNQQQGGQRRVQARVITVAEFARTMGVTWISRCASRHTNPRFPRVITDADRAALIPTVFAVLADVQTLRTGGTVVQRVPGAPRQPRAPATDATRTLQTATPVQTAAAPQAQAAANEIVNTITRLDEQMDIYENADLQDEALTNIPFSEIHATADSMQSDPSTALPCFEDALAHALVKWFKPNFFTWIDPIKCDTCGENMQSRGAVVPTEEERTGRASRTEVWRCEQDGNVTRFPRYDDLRALMKSRKGRCGEFANLFSLMLRAVGLRTRYVWNIEDHLWNEYYSPAQSRWIHLDSCECSRDEPHIYDRGWAKKMSYVIAFSVDGAVDVSRRYIYPGGPGGPDAREKGGREGESWEELRAERRRRISEEVLEQTLKAVTARRRVGKLPEDLTRLEAEDAAEAKELAAGPPSDDPMEVDGKGRTSGTKEWVDSRGEGGTEPPKAETEGATPAADAMEVSTPAEEGEKKE